MPREHSEIRNVRRPLRQPYGHSRRPHTACATIAHTGRSDEPLSKTVVKSQQYCDMMHLASLLAQQWVNMGSSHSGFCLDLLTADQLHRLDATVRQVVVAAQPDLTVRSHQIQRQFTYSPRSFELMDVAELSRNMMWSMMDEVTAYVRALETKETLMNKTGVQRTCYYIQGLNTHVDHHSTLRLHCNVIQLETASPT
jgi:hypothetical protein